MVSNVAAAGNDVIASSNDSTGETYLFAERTRNTNTLSSEQAFAHMVKAMLGTGLLSLPLAFKHAGLWLGLVLMVVLCGICLYCMRLVVYAAHYIFSFYRNGRDVIDYANVMRSAVESGPTWISIHGYFFKQLLNINMFCAQLGFCCVYFVFMADNIQSFFDMNTMIHLPRSVWMGFLLVPILSICSIRHLNKLAPFALAANCLYLCAVFILLYFFFTHLKPSSDFPAVGQIENIPLYFGTVLFAFEGVAVVLPVENRMCQPKLFIKWNGVLNCSCLVVMVIFMMMGFYGYLAVGDEVEDAITLNLPHEPIYQSIKLIFSMCVMVSYPLQFFIPMERVEKWVTRKIPVENQTVYIYFARYGIVLLTCAIAELIPHLALFISFIGAFSGSSMALLFPPFIDLLISHSRGKLVRKVWIIDLTLILFALVGLVTGTYTALVEIFKKIAEPV
uniref:Aa_trans domain-containing protein n=1 Tax=Elaeophora elaphi TaxID=1147741 RepID=A0A0R3RM79_9BILA